MLLLHMLGIGLVAELHKTDSDTWGLSLLGKSLYSGPSLQRWPWFSKILTLN